MTSRRPKKERRRLKQKHKKLLRLRSEGPYRQVGTFGNVEACLTNDNWQENGEAVILVLVTSPRAGCVMAMFLIDLWCAGLKDAWGRLNFSHQEFRDMVEEMSLDVDMHLVPVDLETARGLIAGAIRFARQNGFRLPPRYERWTAVIGGVGDEADADLSAFGADGKLRWVGPIDDLRRRLLGSTVEEFLQREDVEFILGEEQPPFDEADEADEADEVVEEATRMLHDRALDAARRWCFAHGEAPHPRLAEAIDLQFEAILQTGDVGPDASTDDQVAAGTDNVAQMLAMEDPEKAVEIVDAMEQLGRFASSFQTPEQLYEAVGIPADDEEDLPDFDA